MIFLFFRKNEKMNGTSKFLYNSIGRAEKVNVTGAGDQYYFLTFWATAHSQEMKTLIHSKTI